MKQDSSTLVGHDGPDTVDPWTGISEDVIRRFFDVLCIERGLPKGQLSAYRADLYAFDRWLPYITGGGAYGVHPLGANVQDPVAQEFFTSFPVNAEFVLNNFALLGILIAVVTCIVFVVTMAMEFSKSRKAKH